MTFDFPENDIRMSQYIADKVVEIGRAMGGKSVIRGGTKAAVHHDGVSEHAQLRRRNHGRQSQHECRQSIPSVLGRIERVQPRWFGISSEWHL